MFYAGLERCSLTAQLCLQKPRSVTQNRDVRGLDSSKKLGCPVHLNPLSGKATYENPGGFTKHGV